MNGSVSSKKRIIFISIIAVLVVGLIVAGVVLKNKSGSKGPNSQSSEYTDKDTGDVISNQPGVTKESATTGDEGNTVLTGLAGLGNFGSVSLSTDELPVFRHDLLANALTKFPSHDGVVKVVNPRINHDTLLLDTDFIYKDGVAPATISLDIANDTQFSYQVFVSGSMIYDSGQLYTTSNAGD